MPTYVDHQQLWRDRNFIMVYIYAHYIHWNCRFAHITFGVLIHFKNRIIQMISFVLFHFSKKIILKCCMSWNFFYICVNWYDLHVSISCCLSFSYISIFQMFLTSYCNITHIWVSEPINTAWWWVSKYWKITLNCLFIILSRYNYVIKHTHRQT